MPDLLTLDRTEWRLNVWCNSIVSAQKQLTATLSSRNAVTPSQEIRFSTVNLIATDPAVEITPDGVRLKEPIFFENRSYEFEFIFPKGATDVRIVHRLNQVQDAFRQKDESLRGTINFGNDIGWFRLTLNYSLNGKAHSEHIAFEVLPVKMDMANDLNGINASLDRIYPLWRFSFAKKTDLELSRSKKPHERFPLLWLAQFEALRQELGKQARIVCSAPHARLQENIRHIRMDRLKGKLSPRLEERVHSAIATKENPIFQIKNRKLSVDTPENRFVLMVLRHSSNELSKFVTRARAHNGSPDKERVANSFFDTLSEWQKSLNQHASHGMFADVGRFEGLERESLVLHQRAGYSGVYRVWQQLKQYLDVFGKHASISMKSVSELYEVWCFLEIRNHLLSLGFNEDNQSVAALKVSGLEKELEDGLGASFKFSRDDGLKIRLAHEPVFKKPKASPKFDRIYSWNAVQKPDIVLEVTFPNGELIHWIFDAKYRVDNAQRDGDPDLAPDDAINQMHRYRDALIHLALEKDGTHKKTRPFIGAYVLYPGWYPEQTKSSENPYAEAIEAVGIGAFPALPGQTNQWLLSFLNQHLARRQASVEYGPTTPDQHLAQESVRISPTGLSLKRDGNLIFVAPVGPNRTQAYLNGFTTGTASWYHTRQEALDRQLLSKPVMNDITHVAIAVPDANDHLSISYLFEVKSVIQCKRESITADQAGTDQHSSKGMYWLLELGNATPLAQSLILPKQEHFEFALCSNKDLAQASEWKDVSKRYNYLSEKN